MNKFTYMYLRNIILNIVFYLPGVFENGYVPNAVNGSLWSLPIEFFMYITLGIYSFIIYNTKFLYLFLFIVSLLLYIFWADRRREMLVVYSTDLRQIFITGTYFWSGAIFSAFDLKRYLTINNAIIVMVLLLSLEPYPTILKSASFILLPYLILAFALSPAISISQYITKYGDFSYGFYIYSFPVQQIIAMLKPNISLIMYLLICTLLTLPFAIFSWRIIEQPIMRLKSLKH